MYSRVMSAASVIALLAACGGSDKKNPVGPDSACSRGSLTLGTVRTGTVASGDCVFSSSSFASGGKYDAYSVALTAGQVYQVLHQATVAFDFDAFVEVVEPGGVVIAFSDDDAQSLNSELFFVAPTTGAYSIRAGGLKATELGDYRLTIRSCGATQLTSTASVGGALTSGDCRTTFTPASDSSLADIFLFTNTGTSRDLTVTSSTFSPAFVVAGPTFGLESAFFDLSSLGSPATLTVPGGTMPSGTYLVIVSAAGAITGDGSYAIQSSVASSSTRLAPSPSRRAAWHPSAKGR